MTPEEIYERIKDKSVIDVLESASSHLSRQKPDGMMVHQRDNTLHGIRGEMTLIKNRRLTRALAKEYQEIAPYRTRVMIENIYVSMDKFYFRI